jgi:predicted RNase H-like HicB family nuclease
VNIKVVIHAAEEGGYWAEVPALPGCVSQGETVDELLANAREAVQAWFEAEEPEASGAPEGQRVVELQV